MNGFGAVVEIVLWSAVFFIVLSFLMLLYDFVCEELAYDK